MLRKVFSKTKTVHEPKHTTSSVKYGGGSIIPVELGHWDFLMRCLLIEEARGNVCPDSAPHNANGYVPKAYCKSNSTVSNGKEIFSSIAKSVA